MPHWAEILLEVQIVKDLFFSLLTQLCHTLVLRLRLFLFLQGWLGPFHRELMTPVLIRWQDKR